MGEWARRVRRRVPVGEVEEVLRLYREKYFDFNVRHFHEKLSEDHDICFSYTWVKNLLAEVWACGSIGKAKEAQETAGKKAAGGNDAAHRRVRAPVVWRWAEITKKINDRMLAFKIALEAETERTTDESSRLS